MRLRPFFSYYGSKWRLAPKYSKPKFDTIIEPFAGSASYSLLYPKRKVKLIDIDDNICVLWEYLINVKEKEIRALPLLERNEPIPTHLSQGAKNLIGFWTTKGSSTPAHKMTGYKNISCGFWGESIRERVAEQLEAIRHWTTIQQTSYEKIEDQEATWFIDPPYQSGGQYYRMSNKKINYQLLGDWCKSRDGQSIVCENGTAEWLPFSDFKSTRGITKITKELIWEKK